MTPAQPAPMDDAGAMAVLDAEIAMCPQTGCDGTGFVHRADGEAFTCNACAELREARAHLAARLAELEAENDRAWTAANRADAKVRGWEATMVCTGLPFRVCPVDGWGPGADGTVEIPQLTTEKLTSILDRLARAEAELAAVRANAITPQHGELGAAIDRAAGELPEGWEIRVCVEGGAGWAELFDPHGDIHHYPEGDTLADHIANAIDSARGAG